LTIRVVAEPWRPHPLAWIHRAEARAIARELNAPLTTRTAGAGAGMLLRLSDPVMRQAVQALTRAGIAYRGPGAAVLERCYDKYEATRAAHAAGIDGPETTLGPRAFFGVRLVKPRRGSDSIGLRIVEDGRVPDGFIAQALVVGAEHTVAVFRDRVGLPLRIHLPEGTAYSFARKYLLRPTVCAIRHPEVQVFAQRVARLFGVDWAARVDLIEERGTGRLVFLECDAAPLVGPRSAWAASFCAAGVGRAEQLGWLLEPSDRARR
jgi:D-alanine-D-alanine ligase-like ATP-grasp enzyme